MKQRGYAGYRIFAFALWANNTVSGKPFAKGPYLGQTPPGPIALAFGISTTVGIIFGLYPACRAANMEPIESLRRE